MKNLILILYCSSICFFTSHSQANHWALAENNGESYVNQVISDNHGNIYFDGVFWSKYFSLGGKTITNTYYDPNVGSLAAYFVGKLDNNGNVIWLQSIVSSGIVDNSIINIDNNGDLILLGTYYGDLFAKSNHLKSINYSIDFFVIKYDKNGNLLFVKNIGSDNEEGGFDVITDSNDNIYITGSFSSNTIQIDSLQLKKASASSWDGFLIKLDSNGRALYTKSFGGDNAAYPKIMTIDNNDNIILNGVYSGNILKFDSIILKNHGKNGFNEVFTVKFDSNGSYKWAKSINGIKSEWPGSIDTDEENNVYVTAWFDSDTIILENKTLIKNYPGTAFDNLCIAKYNSNGDLKWAKSIDNGIASLDAGSIKVKPSGDFYWYGTFDSTAQKIDGLSLTNFRGQTDLFIIKFDTDGKAINAKSIGGNKHDLGSNLEIDINENVYTGGWTNSDTLYLCQDTLVPIYPRLDPSRSAPIASFITKLGKLDELTNQNDIPKVSTHISISPNPATQKMSISLSTEWNELYDLEVRIYSSLGELLNPNIIKHSQSNYELNCGSLSSGIYYLKIGNKSKSEMIKFMVMH